MSDKLSRVYISVDIEGMEGVVSKLQTLRSSPDFGLARRRLTLDVNEAVRACLDSGAEEVVVCDGHADMENLLLDELHPEAKLISGAMRSSLQMQMIETGFDAVVLFGHSGAGMAADGVLNHMYNSRKIYNLRLDGVTVNTEAVCNAYIAGHYQTPLVAVIGDEAVCREVATFIPQVEQVVVKQGISRYCALSLSPAKARELIYRGVWTALERRAEIPPLALREPVTMEIDYMDSGMADTASLVPGVERLKPRTVRFVGDAPTVFRVQELLVFRLMDEFSF